MGEKFIPGESQIYDMYADKARNTKEQYIITSSFKIDNPPILGGLRKRKESTTPHTVIITP